jgi:protein-S-isoprenylcysteine O-methyltransferase Ste14
MKKSQKRLLILMMIIPAIILPVFLIIHGMSVNKIPWWAIIGILIVTLASILIFLFTQNSAQQVYDAPLQKQRKRILTVWGAYSIFTAIVLIILYYVRYQLFLTGLVFPALLLPSLFFVYFRVFFPKNTKSIENNNQNNSGS